MHGIPHGVEIRDRDSFRDIVAGSARVTTPGPQPPTVFNDLFSNFPLFAERQQVYVNVPMQGYLVAVFFL